VKFFKVHVTPSFARCSRRRWNGIFEEELLLFMRSIACKCHSTRRHPRAQRDTSVGRGGGGKCHFRYNLTRERANDNPSKMGLELNRK
jgi:hypothetical protein